MNRPGRKPPRELTYEEYLALFGPLLPSRPGERPDAYEEGREVAKKIVTRSDTGAAPSPTGSEEQSK